MLPVVAILVIVGLATRDAIPQPLDYHAFADSRRVLGIANVGNVLSNVPFLLIGMRGIAVARRMSREDERGAWMGLFLGVTLTSFGSSWYQLAPSNDSLLWDRLPMTLGFTALFAGIVGERVSTKAYRVLLAPSVVVGAASVLYWYATEQSGHGDLRPYIFVQFVPLLASPVLLALFPAKYSHGRYFILALASYVAAKGLESADASIFRLTAGIVSGHTLKHLAAAGGCAFLVSMCANRTRLTPARAPSH